MTAPLLLGLVVAWAGTTLLLGALPWFRRVALPERLAPYTPTAAHRSGGRMTAAHRRVEPSWVALIGPVAERVGERLARLLGVRSELTDRLRRAGSGLDPTTFRLRQLGHAVAGLGLGALVATVIGPTSLVGLAAVVSVPVLWVLHDEQRLTAQIGARARRIQLELPVVAEQLGILITAGASLPAALARVAERGRGAVARDLDEVNRRLRRGVPEREALAEWERRTDLGAVRRLVGVLALHREATDLGRLVTEEARSIRAETHRALLEELERRSQLVWIPVTVATLVPGLLLLAVPFLSALRQVTGP